MNVIEFIIIRRSNITENQLTSFINGGDNAPTANVLKDAVFVVGTPNRGVIRT